MENKNNSEERRHARRKRRIVSQVFAYVFMLIVIAAIIYGGYRLVKVVVKAIKAGNEPVTVSEDVVEDVVSEDEVGVIATPDSIIEDSEELITEVDTSELGDITVPAEPDEPSEEELAYIAGLSTEQKAAQLFIVTPESITGVMSAIQAGNGTKTALSNYMVGGIVYDNRNVIDADQFAELINNTNSMYSELYSQDVIMLAVGNETIEKLTPSAGEGATVTGVYGSSQLMILSPEYYDDGALSSDELPEDTDIVILPNVSADEMTTDVPYSMSSLLINDTIRDAGYRGVIVTGFMDGDDVTSSYGAGEAAVLAISSGADMILRSADFNEAYQAVIDAINDGTITEERLNLALAHIYRLRKN